MNKQILILLMIFSFCPPSDLDAQKEDHQWLFGLSITSLGPDSINGITKVDFNFDPPRISYIPNVNIDFRATAANLSDTYGKLILYSNGQEIYGEDHTHIINGEKIATGGYWNNWRDNPVDRGHCTVARWLDSN